MKTKFVKALLISLACITTFTFYGCGTSSSSTKTSSSTKKIINIGIMNAPSAFNPLDTADSSETYMTEILFRPLMDLDSNLKFIPALADSITTTDNKTFTVNLNKNAKWTDGQPVTADDLMFTIGLITNPKVTSSLSSQLNMLSGLDDNGKNTSGKEDFEGAKKVDDHTVTLITKEPVDTTIFNDLISQYLRAIPKHILKDVAPEQIFKAEFFQNPNVTDGPFKFTTYKKDQYVQLTANKNYFKGTPKLSGINFKVMQGTEITVQLQSGEIDMNEPNIGVIPTDDVSKVKAMKNITTSKTLTNTLQVVELNTKTIPDARVRKAISYAINRKQIVSNLLKGSGEEAIGPYTKSSKFYDSSANFPSYNKSKAKELLKEANWDPNKVLKFNVPTGNTVREQAASIIQQNLQDIGIKVQIQKYDFVTTLNLGKKHDFDLCAMGLLIDPVNPDFTQNIGTNQLMNLSAYSNPEIDNLLKTGKVTIGNSKRAEIYNKIQQIYANDLPICGVYAPQDIGAVNTRVINAKPVSFGMYASTEKWDVAK